MNLFCTVQGQGETLVLVHGWGMHSGVWDEFAQHLAESFQVVCIDLPGHGHSPLHKPFTIPAVCEQLVACVAKQPCFWLGWSLGATLVLEIVKRYPDSVKGLSLLAGNPHFLAAQDWPGMDPLMFEKFTQNVAQQGETAVLNFLLLQLSVLPNAREELKVLKNKLDGAPLPKLEALLQGLKILATADERPVFQDLAMPLQILLGELDNLVPIASAEVIKKLNPKAQLSQLKDAAHMPFLSHQQQVVTLVNDFISEVA